MSITLINDAPWGGSLEKLIGQFNQVIADLAELKATFDAHTHASSGAGVPNAAFIGTGANAFTPAAQTIILKK